MIYFQNLLINEIPTTGRNDTILLLSTIHKADNRHNFDPVRYLHCPKILRSNTGSIQSRHKLLHNHIDIRQYLKEK